jgi:serine phosphatase RsbU (regulator of sigma subunit)
MRVSRAAVITLLVGLLITAGLSALSYIRNDHNESRLLKLQTQTGGAILQVIVPVIETPLSSAAQIAVTSSGATAPFEKYISPFVGAKGSFTSASLWEVTPTSTRLLDNVGQPSILGTDATAANGFLGAAAQKMTLHVSRPLGNTADIPRLGYAFAAKGDRITYVVYAETNLPKDRRAPIDPTSPLRDLRFALYIGTDRSLDNLLETNSDHVPITGRTSTVSVPFGDQSLTLVATAGRPLGGSLSGTLWWIVAIVGSLISLGAALAAERLTRRRVAAELLTVEIRGLLGQQRTIAEALQRALLPEGTPVVDGMRIASRYYAGEHGLEIGGDWYDVVPLGGGRFFFVVGDVSGRGIRAGSVMAALRFAIRGFITEGHGPAEVLDRLGPVLDEVGDGLIATVLCGTADVARHEVVLATAGHPPPLLVHGDTADYVDITIGPPVGVRAAEHYASTTVAVPSDATLIAYTDGLVERRDESLDSGLERLRSVARENTSRTAHEMADAVVAALADPASDDDTAVLVLQWVDEPVG